MSQKLLLKNKKLKVINEYARPYTEQNEPKNEVENKEPVKTEEPDKEEY